MKWFIILFAAALLGYFLWIKGHIDQSLPEKLVPMMVKQNSNGTPAETPDAPPPEKTELKNVNPGLTGAGKVYTAEDIKKINEKLEKHALKKNAFTNANLKKYHERPGKPDIEQVRKDIQWAEDPAPKKAKKK